MVSLEEFAADSVANLPVIEDTNITLDPQNCKAAPREMETSRVKILTGYHDYEDVRYDIIDFFADKSTYRALGMLIFSAMFHPNSVNVLHVRHPETKIRQLIIECPVSNPTDPYPGELVLIPAAYGYWPSIPKTQHPLYFGNWSRWRQPLDREYLPQMIFTNEDGMCVNDEQRAARDVVKGFGSPRGACTLAALLLDIGLPGTERTEFCLEGPAGFQSLVPMSAEGRFWVGYDYT